jgi:serine/threonine protein kinase
LESDNLESEYETLFKNQCSTLSELTHPNIVKFYGYSLSKNPLESVMVTEYLPGGTLYDRLFQSPATAPQDRKEDSKDCSSTHHPSPVLLPLMSLQRISLAIDIAKAIAYQHGIHLTDWSLEEIREMKSNLSQYETDTQNNQTNTQITYHKDIRSRNILLSADLTGKLKNTTIDQLIDEKLSEDLKVVNHGYTGRTPPPTSSISPSFSSSPPLPIAPEVLSGSYVLQSEIYSFGVILFELLCSKPADKLMPLLSKRAQDLDSAAFYDFIQTSFAEIFSFAEWKPEEVAKICKIGQDCIQSDFHSRPSSMRIILLALLQIQYDMVGYTCALDSSENHLQILNSSLSNANSHGLGSSNESLPVQAPVIIRYHTGHYRRYYGGPTNGRWSCCESYDRDAEGCHSGTQVRHHPDRNKLWGEGYNWNCCGQQRTTDGCVSGPQIDQLLLPSSTPVISQSPPPLPSPSQSSSSNSSTRYHTGHYRRYYGGPTNGRWSCCESYDQDAEGCHSGTQVRHHPDRNKLWGEGYNWNCCGRERTADGCKAGPQPGQLLAGNVSAPTRMTTSEASRPSSGPSSAAAAPQPPVSPSNRIIRYHTGHYRRYYGGPTNGRWSCCESYDREVEGCHSGTQVRHHPDRNKLWGEGYNWNCCGRERTADGCIAGPPSDQLLVNPAETVIAPPVATLQTPPQSPSSLSLPSRSGSSRYHTGHYKPYYGGPTNGRWSCCESYDREAEGCQNGSQVRHHPDCNKLWGEGYNWNCCGQERTADGCKAGPQVGQYLIDPPAGEVVAYHPGNYRSYVGGPSNGRWSCCESFNQEAGGCHRGTHPKHHPDLNKLWGTQHNWSCCGQSRAADGCTMGPHPHPIQADASARNTPPRGPRNAPGPSSLSLLLFSNLCRSPQDQTCCSVTRPAADQ